MESFLNFFGLCISFSSLRGVSSFVIWVFEISSPRASTEAKPGKAKKKPWNSFRAVSHANDIEIYEGKVVAVGVRDIEVTSPETGYLCIRCQGEEQRRM
jgi:hypothetical protein